VEDWSVACDKFDAGEFDDEDGCAINDEEVDCDDDAVACALPLVVDAVAFG
jgi:hypothetical protein